MREEDRESVLRSVVLPLVEGVVKKRKDDIDLFRRVENRNRSAKNFEYWLLWEMVATLMNSREGRHAAPEVNRGYGKKFSREISRRLKGRKGKSGSLSADLSFLARNRRLFFEIKTQGLNAPQEIKSDLKIVKHLNKHGATNAMAFFVWVLAASPSDESKFRKYLRKPQAELRLPKPRMYAPWLAVFIDFRG